MNITSESLLEALLAETAAVRASINTRTMGHTSYVTKAELRRQAAALHAMRSLVIRANEFHALPADVADVITATIAEANAEAAR